MTDKEKRPVNNAEEKAKAFLRLSAVIAALRAPDGCPWDREQTSYSLAPNFLEEAHELIDAIESGETKDIIEEAGDVILHALMQAQLFEEQGKFDSADVLNAESDKLVRRHPHVFGTLHVKDSEEVMKNWEAIKKEEKPPKGNPSWTAFPTRFPPWPPRRRSSAKPPNKTSAGPR